jgi:hypothetical protein
MNPKPLIRGDLQMSGNDPKGLETSLEAESFRTDVPVLAGAKLTADLALQRTAKELLNTVGRGLGHESGRTI